MSECNRNPIGFDDGERIIETIRQLKQLREEKERNEVILGRLQRMRRKRERDAAGGDLGARVRVTEDNAGASYIPPTQRPTLISLLERAMDSNAKCSEIIISDDDDDEPDKPDNNYINLDSDEDEIVVVPQPSPDRVDLVSDEDDEDAATREAIALSVIQFKKDAERNLAKIPNYENERGAGCSTWPDAVSKPSPRRITPTKISDATGAEFDKERELAEEVRLEMARLAERDDDPANDLVRKIIGALDSAKNIRDTIGNDIEQKRADKRALVKQYLEEFSKKSKNRITSSSHVELGDEDSDVTDRSDNEEWEVRSTDDDGVTDDDYDDEDRFIDDEDEDADRDNLLYKELMDKMSEHRLGLRDIFNKEDAATKRLLGDVIDNLQKHHAEISDFDETFIRNDKIKIDRENARNSLEKTSKNKTKRDLIKAVLANKIRKFKPVGDAAYDDDIYLRSDSDPDIPRVFKPTVKKERREDDTKPKRRAESPARPIRTPSPVVIMPENSCSLRSLRDSEESDNPFDFIPQKSKTKPKKKKKKSNPVVYESDDSTDFNSLKSKTKPKPVVYESDDSVDFRSVFGRLKKKKKRPAPDSTGKPLASMAPVRSRMMIAADESCPAKKRALPPSVTGGHADKNNKYAPEMVEMVHKMHEGKSPYQFDKGRFNRTQPEIRALLSKSGLYKNVPAVSTISRMIMLKKNPGKLKKQETAKRARSKEKKNKAVNDLTNLTTYIRQKINKSRTLDQRPAIPPDADLADVSDLVDFVNNDATDSQDGWFDNMLKTCGSKI